MPGGGFSPTLPFDSTKPAGSTKGYDAPPYWQANWQRKCNADAKEHYDISGDPDASDDDTGRHDFITLKERAAKPVLTGMVTRTPLYRKSTGIYFEKDDGTEVCVLLFSGSKVGNDIPSGEIILFEKDTAVVGYTLLTDKDDMAVYITKGSAAGGQAGAQDKTGGTWTLSGLTHVHTHNIPNHSHWLAVSGTVGYYASTLSSRIVRGSDNYIGSQTDPGTGYYVLAYTATDGGGGATGYGSTSAISSAGTWRLPGRTFTRQQRN